MFRILTLALVIAFAGSLAPALAQATGGSPGKSLKKPMTTTHSSKSKSKSTHHGRKGGKSKKKNGGSPPATHP